MRGGTLNRGGASIGWSPSSSPPEPTTILRTVSSSTRRGFFEVALLADFAGAAFFADFAGAAFLAVVAVFAVFAGAAFLAVVAVFAGAVFLAGFFDTAFLAAFLADLFIAIEHSPGT
jgi:hypothetical protein